MAAILSPERLGLALMAWVAAVWLGRVVWMSRFRRGNPPLEPVRTPQTPSPKVSIIIPMKNEEHNVANCLDHLFAQKYPDFEVIVVDDRSDDRTPELLSRYAKHAPVPFRALRIEKLPPGWTGKNYAMHTGSRAASGSWLLETDADTTHEPWSLATAMHTALERKIDLLTLAPETEAYSFWERVVQPLAVSSLALWFGTDRVNDADSPHTLANGQFILVKRAVYDQMGGNEAVRGQIVEDVEFAKLAKKAGFNVKFLNGTRLYRTRMYTTLSGIRRGWTRIFTYLFQKRLGAVLHKMGLYLVFSLSPFLVAAFEAAVRTWRPELYSRPLMLASLGVCALITAVRAAGNRLLKTDPVWALFHPLGSLVMLWILGECAERIVFNKRSVWKGDQLPA